MKLIYVLGPAHGKVEDFKPPLGAAWLPPEFTRQPIGKSDPDLGELHVRYDLVQFDRKEAYYIPHQMSKGYAIKLLANMVGENNES